MKNHENFEQLAVGYALYALEPDDEQLLVAHLATCASCAKLISDVESMTTDWTQTSAGESLPTGLRDRIIAAASKEPRAPRVPMPQDPWVTSAPLVKPRRMSRGRERVLAGALAAVVGIAIAIPTTLALSGSGSGNAGDRALAQKLLEANSREVSLTGAGTTAHAKAVLAPSGALVIADGLPINDAQRSTYVVWAANQSGARTAMATFDVSNGKAVQVATMSLPYNVNEITQVDVSYEPGRKAPAAPSDILLSGTRA